jgi:hypothetical protein
MNDTIRDRIQDTLGGPLTLASAARGADRGRVPGAVLRDERGGDRVVCRQGTDPTNKE